MITTRGLPNWRATPAECRIGRSHERFCSCRHDETTLLARDGQNLVSAQALETVSQTECCPALIRGLDTALPNTTWDCLSLRPSVFSAALRGFPHQWLPSPAYCTGSLVKCNWCQLTNILHLVQYRVHFIQAQMVAADMQIGERNENRKLRRSFGRP